MVRCSMFASRPCDDSWSREAWIVPPPRRENRIRIPVRNMGVSDAGMFRRGMGSSGVFRSSHSRAAGLRRCAGPSCAATTSRPVQGNAPMNPHALALGLSLPVLALAGAQPVQQAVRQDRAHCLQRGHPAERAAPRRSPGTGAGSRLPDAMNPTPVEAPSANPSVASPGDTCPYGMSRRMRRVMLAVERHVSFPLRGSRRS